MYTEFQAHLLFGKQCGTSFYLEESLLTKVNFISIFADVHFSTIFSKMKKQNNAKKKKEKNATKFVR